MWFVLTYLITIVPENLQIKKIILNYFWKNKINLYLYIFINKNTTFQYNSFHNFSKFKLDLYLYNFEEPRSSW